MAWFVYFVFVARLWWNWCLCAFCLRRCIVCIVLRVTGRGLVGVSSCCGCTSLFELVLVCVFVVCIYLRVAGNGLVSVGLFPGLWWNWCLSVFCLRLCGVYFPSCDTKWRGVRVCCFGCTCWSEWVLVCVLVASLLCIVAFVWHEVAWFENVVLVARLGRNGCLCAFWLRLCYV